MFNSLYTIRLLASPLLFTLLFTLLFVTACDTTQVVDNKSSENVNDTMTDIDTSTSSAEANDSDSVETTDSNSGTGDGGGCISEDTDTGTGLDITDTVTTADTTTTADTASAANTADTTDTTDTTDTADTASGTESNADDTSSSAADSSTSSENTDSDTGDSILCPSDMVLVAPITDSSGNARFCIDRYEASRSDATAGSAGTDESVAMSVYGVLPWYVRPMSAEALDTFKTACLAAGKYLCNDVEWEYSCKGHDNTNYVWGNDFDVEICNNVATFCDDYCEKNGIAEDACNLNTFSCGYHCGDATLDVNCFQMAPTGQFTQCTNAIGTFDINGNLWEIVTSETATSGYEIRGGAFNCASPSSRLQCSQLADWTDLYAGFRCCKDTQTP
ncbi:MAG: SUMF1/EgtB/PvdO family nonheme iron enzyme [Deltaproteobacteria bacterium]|nr:SUMF1/EgtB/PvdO family nonheme iron enzyme [Deltaproteobacteria bacterium]